MRGTRSRCSRHCGGRTKLEQHQAFRIATLHHTSPLFPYRVLPLLGVLLRLLPRLQGPLVEAGLIHLNVFPGLGSSTKHDALLNLWDVTAADEVEIVVHPLDCFVVDVGEQVDGGKRNSSQSKKKCGSLYLETVPFGTTNQREDGVQMKRIDKLLAILLVAPVGLGLSLRSCGQWPQDALVAEGADTAFPIRHEVVFHKDVQDLGVRGLQELLDGAVPFCLVSTKKTGMGPWTTMLS